MATVFGFWETGIGLPKLDWPSTNGHVYTPFSSHTVQFFSGAAFHYADGMVFAMIFVILLHRKLPFPSTPLGNIGKSLLTGLNLEIIGEGYMTPYVYAPH
jgi:uncharacterized membrane protein YagU involved in acid resistance